MQKARTSAVLHTLFALFEINQEIKNKAHPILTVPVTGPKYNYNFK